MPDGTFVRVELDNGMEATMSAAFVEGTDGAIKTLDEPATNSWGRPLPPTRKNGRRIKPRTTVKKAAAKKATANRSATTGGAAAARSEEGTE